MTLGGKGRRQVNSRELNQQTVSSYTDTNEWQNHTSFPNNEIPWHDAGGQIALEDACKKKRQ
jgi:hypothetical protein